MKNRLSSCLLSIIASALAAQISIASPFSNGNFDTGSPTNGLLNSGDSVSIPSWTTGGPSQTLEFNTNFNGQTAQSGANFISFGHNGTTGGTLSQTFDTIVGAVYQVSYFVSRIQGGTSAQSMSVSAFVGTSAVLLNSAATTIPDAGQNNVWTAGTGLTFTALSNTTTLQFLDTTPAGGGVDSNWALDTVGVITARGPSNGVPESGSTLALTALSLLGLVASRRWFARAH
ncbi:MAG: VPDSG-CTERM sorting domain-containing protein [Verrucomicrobiota bacterium]|nr:VPDSG-CTERM sorting domain-containing protein [Verrucomicrobiota bacterium]MDQ6938935.1 VPDSG-CTERM sorting domain-containing protein [Verrucomicrobiota bacterium]